MHAVPAPLPLFSALLNYRHSPGAAEALSQEAQEAWEGMQVLRSEERTNYPLTLSINDLGRGFSLDAESPAVIGPLRVCQYTHTDWERWLKLWTRIRALRFPIFILPPAERQQIVYEWNDTAREYPQKRCIHELFEEQVRKTRKPLPSCMKGSN